MIDVFQEGNTIVFDVQGLHKLWAFKSRLQIPRHHIRSVRQDPEALRGWWKGWRIPGTHIPGLLTAGTFLRGGKQIFWDVHNSTNAIIVELEHEAYQQLIIEVENPATVIALLSA